MSESVKLPGLDRAFAPLGVGTWAWGDSSTWGMGTYDTALTADTIAEAWDASLESGVEFFDTAEVYGSGESERIIGEQLRRNPTTPVLATKFMPMPQKLDVSGSMSTSLEASLERLGVERVDLYQIHGPISLRGHRPMAKALAEQVERGLVSAVGVSNYSVKEMTAIHRELGEHGVPLASNQIEFSLLRRRPETGGLLERCRRLGVIPLAYSPIGQGRLTGKYSASNPPPGKRGFSAHPMEDIDPLVDALREIGDRHGDKTPAQVSLRWLIEKGAVPIPGAKNRKQAEQNAGALGWELGPDDMATLDGLAIDRNLPLKQRFWQHG